MIELYTSQDPYHESIKLKIEENLKLANANIGVMNADVPETINDLSSKINEAVNREFVEFADCKLFPTWPGCEGSEKVVGVEGEGNDNVSVLDLFSTITKILVRIAVPLIMVGIVYAGYLFISASANDEQVSQAKDYLIMLVIGVGLIIIAYSVIQAIYFFFVQ